MLQFGFRLPVVWLDYGTRPLKHCSGVGILFPQISDFFCKIDGDFYIVDITFSNN